ncbi:MULTISPECIES: META domain-containing protein [Bacteroides]|uniref:META domain-containing protein n=1 Tax=Bacteroides TaxID=816 RepID=UPI00255837E1|nr:MULTISPECIES: META domain-containing protein [Bacteroides]
MNRKIFFIAMVGITLLTSCQVTRHATSSSMIEGEWNITEVNGSAINAHPSPYIGFNTQENCVYGNSGCNKIAGSFDFKGKNGQIELGQMLSTMMACPNMELEQSILQALNSVECIKFLDKEHMALYDKCKKTLLRMERRFHTVPLSDIKGKWRIVTVLSENIFVSDPAPFLNFDTDNSRISAFAGCNRLSGRIKSVEKNILSISNVVSTKMACPDMTTEQSVITGLGQVDSFGISLNGNLLLFSARGNVVMELMRINED